MAISVWEARHHSGTSAVVRQVIMRLASVVLFLCGTRFTSGDVMDPTGQPTVQPTTFRSTQPLYPGTIVTVAGTGTAGSTGDGGPASVAQLNGPNAVAVDAQGNVYISDSRNKAVRQVQAGTRTMSTIAGGATSTQLGMPVGLAVDASGNVYISDMVLFS